MKLLTFLAAPAILLALALSGDPAFVDRSIGAVVEEGCHG